jgi:hypothetical protein
MSLVAWTLAITSLLQRTLSWPTWESESDPYVPALVSLSTTSIISYNAHQICCTDIGLRVKVADRPRRATKVSPKSKLVPSRQARRSVREIQVACCSEPLCLCAVRERERERECVMRTGRN